MKDALGGNKERRHDKERYVARQDTFEVHHDIWPARQVDRTHLWVGMYQFESNRVSLGQVMAVFRPV